MWYRHGAQLCFISAYAGWRVHRRWPWQSASSACGNISDNGADILAFGAHRANQA